MAKDIDASEEPWVAGMRTELARKIAAQIQVEGPVATDLPGLSLTCPLGRPGSSLTALCYHRLLEIMYFSGP